MNIEDLDRETIACVLKSYIDVSAQKLSESINDLLDKDALPKDLVGIVIDYVKDFQKNHIPKLKELICSFENGDATFEEAVIKLSQETAVASQEISRNVIDLMTQYIEDNPEALLD